MESGDERALVAGKLDRRSLLDLANLIAAAQKQGWALVALDCAVETTTQAGEGTANVLATFAPLRAGADLAANQGGARDQALAGFGGFAGTTGLSDSPRSCISGLRPQRSPTERPGH